MIVLVTVKNDEDLIKNESTRVLTTLNINFSDDHIQGQLTPQSFMGSALKSTAGNFPPQWCF